MGDRLENCRRGIAGITECPETVLTGQSPFYLTEPVDYAPQEWFINAVVRIETALPPDSLFQALVSIQEGAGRIRPAVRFGPRILDLDILLYGDRVFESQDLVIPHPRMHQRRFVLKPLCDIDPDVVHPVLAKPMAVLLDALTADSQTVRALS